MTDDRAIAHYDEAIAQAGRAYERAIAQTRADVQAAEATYRLAIADALAALRRSRNQDRLQQARATYYEQVSALESHGL